MDNTEESFLSTLPEHDGTGIFCTYCIDSPVPAAKSCLLCEAFLCDNHVRVHSKSAEHVLTDPTTFLTYRKCLVHSELLKYYCSEEARCICVSCWFVGDHQGHKVELLNKAVEQKKEKLRNILEKLTSKREETEKGAQSLQERSRKIQEKAAGEIQRVTALFRDIRERMEALEKRALSEISRQEEKLSLQLNELIQQLEMKKEELSRQIHHIEELCNMADPLTVLQEQESDGSGFGAFEGEDIGGRERHNVKVPSVRDLDVVLILGTLLTGLAGIVTGVKGFICGQEARSMILDINTNGNHVILSGGRKTAFYSRKRKNQEENIERFKYAQSLSTESFTSGQHYWEMEVSESGGWRLGVAYPSIERGVKESYIGDNSKSWCLCRLDNNYKVIYERKVTNLPHSPSCRRIRILLDYEAGHLSFYELNPVKHLHTFTSCFTEPLHAAFCVWGIGSWVRIISDDTVHC